MTQFAAIVRPPAAKYGIPKSGVETICGVLQSLNDIRWWDSQEDTSAKHNTFFSNVERVRNELHAAIETRPMPERTVSRALLWCMMRWDITF